MRAPQNLMGRRKKKGRKWNFFKHSENGADFLFTVLYKIWKDIMNHLGKIDCLIGGDSVSVTFVIMSLTTYKRKA